MIKNLLSKYGDWIQNLYPVQSVNLSIYRVLYMLILIAILGIPNFTNKIANFPDGFFNPPPFFSLFFNELPPLIYFKITDILIVIGSFLILFGLFTSYSSFIVSFIIIINNGFLFSIGKIDHNFLVWFSVFALSFSNWGKNYSVDSIIFKKKKDSNDGIIIAFLSLCLGFGFFTSGLIKLISGWLSLESSMLKAFFVRNYYIQEKQDFLASFFMQIKNSIFWELGDWFTIVFEIGFLLAVLNPKLFRFFTLNAVFFHGMVLLMFNINFAAYLPLYFIFWVPILNKNISETLNKAITKNKSKLKYIIALTLSILSIWLFLRCKFPALGSTSQILLNFTFQSFVIIYFIKKVFNFIKFRN